MKWCAVIFSAVFLTIVSCFSVCGETEKGIEVSAKSAILLCDNTDDVVFEKNADERLSMASTTKIMTTLIALEHAQQDDKTVTFTQDMIAEGSSMYLKVGDKLKLSDLATGMMMVSGNDSANAVAVTLGGSQEKFADIMNGKAKEIGMNHTHFVTPSGLDDENHYSTAGDMAKLMQYAMHNEDFARLTAQKSMKVTFIRPSDVVNTYVNHNKLLSMYAYCNGGKTGFTKKSGRCLVTSAEKDGVKLIAVTLNAPDDWNDHMKMYDYGFSRLQSVNGIDKEFHFGVDVVGGKQNTVELQVQSGISCVARRGENIRLTRRVIADRFLYAPLKKGEVVGTVQYYRDNRKIGEIPLVTQSSVEYKAVSKSLWERVLSFLGG